MAKSRYSFFSCNGDAVKCLFACQKCAVDVDELSLLITAHCEISTANGGNNIVFRPLNVTFVIIPLHSSEKMLNKRSSFGHAERCFLTKIFVRFKDKFVLFGFFIVFLWTQ